MSLSEVKDYPLSDSDIRKILGDDIRIITYPQLKTMRSIDDCFDSQGRCILLFLTDSPTSGHWCCMLNKKKGIEFFDPYGEAPEEQKDGIPRSQLEALDVSKPYLTSLLRASGRPVYYNTHPFQRESRCINTCGRHCVVRCLYAPYTIQKYASIIKKSGMPPDDFVSGLTYDKLNK
jgi:hypothetical protein